MIWLLAFQIAVGPAQHYEKAKQEFAQREFSAAVSEVDAALHESPTMVPALVLKARLAVFAHRPDVAKSCLITAITADPTSEEAQFFLGAFYYQQNDFKLAISPLETAHSLSPKSPMPVFYLAMDHEASGDEARALELYQQAEDLSRAEIPGICIHSRGIRKVPAFAGPHPGRREKRSAGRRGGPRVPRCTL